MKIREVTADFESSLAVLKEDLSREVKDVSKALKGLERQEFLTRENVPQIE